MLLKYNKTLTDNVLSVNLYCSNYSSDEVAAIKRYGSPKISLDKTYTRSKTVVKHDKIDLYTAFTVTTKFTIPEVTEENETAITTSDLIADADEYIQDISEQITQEMVKVMTKFAADKDKLAAPSGSIVIDDDPLATETPKA